MITNRKGSILILSLWTLTTLGLMAAGVSQSVQQRTHVLHALEQRDQVRYYAEAGIHYAIGRIMDRPYDTLAQMKGWTRKQSIGEGNYLVGYPQSGMTLSDGKRGYVMMDENRKVNVNVAGPEILKRLIKTTTALTDEEADRLAYAIVDYRDPDDHEKKYQVSGSEKHDYAMDGLGYGPKNAGFELIGELNLVRGMTDRIYALMRDHVTVYGDGRLNINTASRAALLSTELYPSLVEKILSLRRGQDEIEGTADDYIFTNKESIHTELQSQFPKMNQQEEVSLTQVLKRQELSVKSSHFTFMSEGYLGPEDIRYRVIAVYGKQEGIRYWREI